MKPITEYDPDEIVKRPPPLPGNTRAEILWEDKHGEVMGYECTEGPAHCRQFRYNPGPPMPFIGPVGGALIVCPTIGRSNFAGIVNAAGSWAMAIGIGTGDESASDIALSSETTTYGCARSSITPVVVGNLITFTKKWTVTTGGSFTFTEAGLFQSTYLMLRNKYYQSKGPVISTDSITATFTDAE